MCLCMRVCVCVQSVCVCVFRVCVCVCVFRVCVFRVALFAQAIPLCHLHKLISSLV